MPVACIQATQHCMRECLVKMGWHGCNFRPCNTQHCLDVVIMRCYYSSGSMCGRDMRRANLLVQRPGALCAEAPLLTAIAQVTHCSQSLSRRGALQVPH